MPADERVRKSEAIASNLFTLLSHSSMSGGSLIIGVFAPMSDEPDWTLSPQLCALKLAFPQDAGAGEMTFHLCGTQELTWRNEFGVKMRVPPEAAVSVQPDVVIVPGLGFSESGQRLGRGGGFYDRWLAKFEGKKIGLCFEAQLLQKLPTEPHDVVMDLVVTEKRVLPLLERTLKGAF